jgi:hypothetical protein
MRKLLGEVGVESITDIKVYRAPIESFVKSLLNLVSGGTFEKAVKSAHYDQMFHLALLINNSYTLDKQAVVKFVRGLPSSGGETVSVPVSTPVTIQQLVDNTKVKMGASKFSNYNARDNNCQVFVKSVLEANNLLTPELEKFVMQDAQAVFSEMPEYTSKVAKAVTDVGAWADKVVSGEGYVGSRVIGQGVALSLSWKSYYQTHTKGKKFGSRSAVNAHMKDLATKYKQSKTV